MLNSAEVRWFWKDSPPLGLEDWYQAATFPPGGGGSRLDAYLVEPGQIELGVKIRGTKDGVEVKGLVSTIEQPLNLEPSLGKIQIWTKWTSQAVQLGESGVVRIHKARSLRKFSIEKEGLREIALNMEEKPCSGEDPPTDGCNVELTKITLADSRATWWTLGLEAFGRFDSIEATLRVVWRHLAAESRPDFGDSIELSYPAWLNLVLPPGDNRR